MIQRDISPIFSITLKREKYTGIKGNNEPVFKIYSSSFLMAKVEMDFKLTKLGAIFFKFSSGVLEKIAKSYYSLFSSFEKIT